MILTNTEKERHFPLKTQFIIPGWCPGRVLISANSVQYTMTCGEAFWLRMRHTNGPFVIF